VWRTQATRETIKQSPDRPSISPFAKVYGGDPEGIIEFNEVVCSYNSAAQGGGCFYGRGKGITSTGTTMQGNTADYGGCICELPC